MSGASCTEGDGETVQTTPTDDGKQIPLSTFQDLPHLKGFEESLAMTLLNSTDAKVVAAAKRIFFNMPAAAPSQAVTTESPSKATVVPTPLQVLSSEAACKVEDVVIGTDNGVKSTMEASPAAMTPQASSETCGNTTAVPLPVTQEATESKMLILKPSPTGFASLAAAQVARIRCDGESKKKQSSTERLQRSRERNRMHARKTRQRKKEHMKNLKARADALKQEHTRLRQVIKEKNTASILLVMCSSPPIGSTAPNTKKPSEEVEKLMKRPDEEIPDPTKITELPTLYLPGHHSQSRMRKGASTTTEDGHEDDAVSLGDGGNHKNSSKHDDIDYGLLGKDRAKCTPAELDRIRRERNRMHAKRTRDRKRLFMEEMEELISQLERENVVLRDHLTELNGGKVEDLTSSPVDVNAAKPPSAVSVCEEEAITTMHVTTPVRGSPRPDVAPSSSAGQFQSLLAAAAVSDQEVMTEVASDASAYSAHSRPTSPFGYIEGSDRESKRQRVDSDVGAATVHRETAMNVVPQCVATGSPSAT